LKQTDKISSEYIQELENKIVDLTLRLKRKGFELDTVEKENHERIRKLVHNLKNPIGIAYSFSEMIAENSEEISKEKLDKYIDVIKKSTDFSVEILNSIANLNRFKSPSYKINSQKTNYCEFLMGVLGEFNSEVIDKNTVITTSFPNNVININIDRDEITLLIRILIRNAFAYSSNNSKIDIKVVETDSKIETTITDQGIGVSEADLQSVFKEFYMVSTYSQDKTKCVGLGLATAKLILKHHKGEIQVSSTFGKGSSFIFSIPKV